MLLESGDVCDTLLGRERPPLDRDACADLGLRRRCGSRKEREYGERDKFQMHCCVLSKVQDGNGKGRRPGVDDLQRWRARRDVVRADSKECVL